MTQPGMQMPNVDPVVVADFGREWEAFDQRALSDAERAQMFDGYFRVFPWDALPPNAKGFDAGCGTGRWAMLVAPRVGHLVCIDPSSAIEVAKRNLAGMKNCSFSASGVDDMPLEDDSMDFGYSLGVLHHIPDTAAGIRACVRKLKKGAPLLLYLYYAFDNQPWWFGQLWRLTDVARRAISRLPFVARLAVTQAIAAGVYWPLARSAILLERAGLDVRSLPLSAYRDRSFYSMRTDALDRFGTKLERRFTQSQIRDMMERSGLEAIRFSDAVPYWCAVGFKR
ncbi:MAG: class I SAM-dependent methyltransferase [Gemmatimonadetes bacterium]|nr:class I SAM-dependent methyltransferase [Gemmatimonadota bacterium]